MEKDKTIHITPAGMSLGSLLLDRLKILRSKGYTVKGYSLSDGYEKTFISEGFSFIKSMWLSRKFSIIYDILFFFENIFVFIKEKPDIVTTYGPKPGLYSRIAARLCGVDLIVHISWGMYFSYSSPWYKKLLFVSMEKFSALFCDYIFSVNNDDLLLMQRYRFKDSSKLGYLGNATDVYGKFNPANYSKEEILKQKEKIGNIHTVCTVGMIARLTKEKGYKEFFNAAAALSQDNNMLFVCAGPLDSTKGDGISEDEISELQSQGIIKYLGRLEHAEVPLFYAAMDIVVLPSYREGFPRTMVEAASMGKPRITTDTRGCREAVDHQKNGFLIRPGNWQDLKERVLILARDKELRQKMGAASRKKAVNDFREDLLVQKIVDVYQDLLK